MPRPQLPSTIVLMGMMGAGKSSVGRALARRVGSGYMGRGRRDDATDLEWLRARFETRDATYREVATLSVDTDDLDVEAIIGRIVDAFAERVD